MTRDLLVPVSLAGVFTVVVSFALTWWLGPVVSSQLSFVAGMASGSLAILWWDK